VGDGELNEGASSYTNYGVFDCESANMEPGGTMSGVSEHKPRILLMGLRRYFLQLCDTVNNSDQFSTCVSFILLQKWEKLNSESRVP